MNFSLRLCMLVGGAFFAAQPLMVEAAARPPPSPRRLLMACMTKQMQASRTISYNEAGAVCKAQLKSREPALASAVPPKPVNALGR